MSESWTISDLDGRTVAIFGGSVVEAMDATDGLAGALGVPLALTPRGDDDMASEQDRDHGDRTLRGTVASEAVAFSRAMYELDGGSFDVLEFMDGPHKWDGEYRAWIKAGRPADATEPGWEAFAAEEARS